MKLTSGKIDPHRIPSVYCWEVFIRPGGELLPGDILWHNDQRCWLWTGEVWVIDGSVDYFG